MILIAPGWPNMAWFWDLVSADSSQSPAAEGSGDPTVPRDPSPRSVKSESTCMAPRTSFIQGKGFSGEVAA